MHKALRVLRENCANPLYMRRRNESASIYRMKKIIGTRANCMQTEESKNRFISFTPPTAPPFSIDTQFYTMVK